MIDAPESIADDGRLCWPYTMHGTAATLPEPRQDERTALSGSAFEVDGEVFRSHRVYRPPL